jgi:hypothetical protein
MHCSLRPCPNLVDPVAAAPGCNLNLPHIREPAVVHQQRATAVGGSYHSTGIIPAAVATPPAHPQQLNLHLQP